VRITSISVNGLFGVFNHYIPLHSAERVTIIHGPNGFGKTVILRMIAAIVEGETSIFEKTPFDEFSLSFDDGSKRVVRRSLQENRKTGKLEARLEFLIGDESGQLAGAPRPSTDKLAEETLKQIDKLVPGPYVLRGKKWLNRTTGRTYSLGAILRKFPKAAAAAPQEYRDGMDVFGDLGNLEVFFVETNRLSSEQKGPEQVGFFDTEAYSRVYRSGALTDPEHRPLAPRVKQYSEDLVQRIRSVLTDYAKHSQESDRTFPERLVRFLMEDHTGLAEREILAKMEELENKRRRLISLGLLDSESGLRNLTEESLRRAREALTIYVGDVQEKLQVFDDLAHRIGALMDILNERFKYKRLRIDRQQGFRVFNDADDSLIEIEDLSSGEQHELVVLYELLFRAPENGLILVDEPEISLHVAWQSRFLSDLIGILKLTDAYAVVATHSPVIIGPRNDLTVELQGPPESVTRRVDA
jgi:predicted ATPase